MIAPALPRWVGETLTHATRGVNALIPDVPRQVAEAAPPPVDVYNAVDDAWVARAQQTVEATPDTWVLTVRIAQQLDLVGTPGDGAIDDTVEVLVMLDGVAADADNAALLADAYRVMRCVRRCLLDAFRRISKDPLVLEGQRFTPPSSIELQSAAPDPGSGRAQLCVLLPFVMQDPWALSPISE